MTRPINLHWRKHTDRRCGIEVDLFYIVRYSSAFGDKREHQASMCI